MRWLFFVYTKVNQKRETWSWGFCSNFLDNFSFWVSTGVYGDVHRVKIMFKKKENALVQMADANQAQLGTHF